jgi:hypothetical protein
MRHGPDANFLPWRQALENISDNPELVPFPDRRVGRPQTGLKPAEPGCKIFVASETHARKRAR